MTDYVKTEVRGGFGVITLDRPKALNSLSLEMVRALHQILSSWRADAAISAVLLRSSSDKALCAGGDIRFFHDKGKLTPQGGSALLEDFFTEEYTLNHLIHHYPKLYIALMDGVVMGGGMGIAQAGPQARLRIVTERSKIAMPEVNIGLFPDVGGTYFLPRCPQFSGRWLALCGEAIGAADAIWCGLADCFVPARHISALQDTLCASAGADAAQVAAAFCAPFAAELPPARIAPQADLIARHFAHESVAQIQAALAADPAPFAQASLDSMQKRSPLLMSVTLEALRRGAQMSVADCLRMERSLVRRTFEHGEVIEGVRALAVDKDNAPRWHPASLAEVTEQQLQEMFAPVWPEWAHPLRHLD
ncbi:enoyl-CoA hydratase/isomerase family protein [Massilia sp. W12]|uniref:enoyl-CoA hydratase/isomerase family protein n=1 Tax=Massilia sp. W12 TaxID=3126507 RepID=UPI0030D12F9A